MPDVRRARYEIGHQRRDGKYNVWKQVARNHRWDWVIVEVFDWLEDAEDYIALKSKPKRPYKVNQNAD